MHFGSFPRKTFLAAALLIAFTAQASFLEQSGTPVTPTKVMTTYGVDVATRVGLKAAIPRGWQLFVHRSVELPESLSWKVDESWISVLANVAKASDIAVLVDWDKRSVYFRTTALALQEQEKRQMLAQAAVTPLPSFSDEPIAAPAPPTATLTAAITPANSSALLALGQTPPEFKTFVAQAPASAPVSPFVVAVLPASAPSSRVMDPVVQTAAALPAEAQAVLALQRNPLPVIKLVPDESFSLSAQKRVVGVVPAAGLATSPSYFLKPAALERILPASPVVAPVETRPVPGGMALAPVSLAPAAFQLEPSTPRPPASSKPALAQVALAFVPGALPLSTPVLVASTTQAQAPAADATLPSYIDQSPLLTAGEGFNRASVDYVVLSAAEKHGYIVSWEAADVNFPGAVTTLGADMGEDMRLVLRALGGRRSPVSIDVFRASSVVRVRNAAGPAEVTFQELPFQGAIREKSASTFSVRVAGAQPVPVVTSKTGLEASTSLQSPERQVLLAGKPAPAKAEAPATVLATTATLPSVNPANVILEPIRVATAVARIERLEQAPPPNTHFLPEFTAPLVTLHVERGQSLQVAIEGILESGWALKWEVNGDMEANTTLDISGESLLAILTKILPRMALSADVYATSKIIVIRPADGALDK